jgi:hypothetical protein
VFLDATGSARHDVVDDLFWRQAREQHVTSLQGFFGAARAAKMVKRRKRSSAEELFIHPGVGTAARKSGYCDCDYFSSTLLHVS